MRLVRFRYGTGLAAPDEHPGLFIEIAHATWGDRWFPVDAHRCDARWWGPTVGWTVSVRLPFGRILSVRWMRELPDKYLTCIECGDGSDLAVILGETVICHDCHAREHEEWRREMQENPLKP